MAARWQSGIPVGWLQLHLRGGVLLLGEGAAMETVEEATNLVSTEAVFALALSCCKYLHYVKISKH